MFMDRNKKIVITSTASVAAVIVLAVFATSSFVYPILDPDFVKSEHYTVTIPNLQQNYEVNEEMIFDVVVEGYGNQCGVHHIEIFNLDSNQRCLATIMQVTCVNMIKLSKILHGQFKYR